MKEGSGIQVFDRAAGLLAVLEASPEPYTLSALAKETGLSASTVHRILGALAAIGFVKQNRDGRWCLGLCLLELGNLVYERFTVRQRALPLMQQLFAKTGLTVNLAIRDGDRLLYIEHVLAPDKKAGLLRRIGSWAPLHITSGGKLFLAKMLPDELRSYAASTGLTAETDHSIQSLDALLVTLSRVRETGWAYDKEEYEKSVHCVAAPIFGPGGVLIATLSLAAQSSTALSPGCIGELVGTAQAVSSLMGARIGERIRGKGYGEQ